MFNSIIIGLGKIGCGYDYNHHPDDYILTHAQAIENHPSFKLIASCSKGKPVMVVIFSELNLSQNPSPTTKFSAEV